jgi:ribonuclease PH
MTRHDGRKPDELRPVALTRGWAKFAEGSCLIEMGNTRVLCTASVEDTVPPWMKNTGRGWVTGEYGMLPRATPTRTQRDATRGKPDGRALEIQRLIGRSLRAVTDLTKIGERTIYLDCDVLQADGGTRTASITAAYVALIEALAVLRENKGLKGKAVTTNVAAVSVGLKGTQELLDLDYAEDSSIDVDMNVVMTGTGRYIEIQATGEGNTFIDAQMQRMLALAKSGIEQLIARQNEAVKELL